jgi:hypothetical protein
MLQRNAAIHARSPLETVSRTFGALIVLGTLAGGGMLLFSQPDPAHAERTQSEAPAAARTKVAAQVGSTKVGSTEVGSLSDPALAPPSGVVRHIPLISGVDPTPPAPPKSFQEPVGAAPAAASATPDAVVSQPIAPTLVVATPSPAIPSSAAAPTQCLPAGLQTVLRDLDAKFGPVTLVSTTELHTDNHSPGSVRQKLHASCRAVDVKVRGDVKAATAYLRSRPEVAGITAFGNNGVIHMDGSEPRRVAQR